MLWLKIKIKITTKIITIIIVAIITTTIIITEIITTIIINFHFKSVVSGKLKQIGTLINTLRNKKLISVP